MKKWIFSLVAIPVLLVGCNEEPVDTLDSGKNIPVAVEVEFVSDLALEPNVEVELAARVTQGGEPVEDADEVKFEVWESGKQEAGVMLEGELTEDGIYTIQHKFPHDGVYYIYAHTTARGMHVMPKVEVIVGNPDMSTVIEDEGKQSMNHSEEQHTH